MRQETGEHMNKQENIGVNDSVIATRNTGETITGTVMRVTGEDVLVSTASGNVLVKWSGLVSIQKV
jgi:hypothetical protein